VNAVLRGIDPGSDGDFRLEIPLNALVFPITTGIEKEASKDIPVESIEYDAGTPPKPVIDKRIEDLRFLGSFEVDSLQANSL